MIVVVSGVPRSGTSLMMQMLAAGGLPVLADGARAVDQDNPRGYYEWEPVKRLPQEPQLIGEAEERAVKVISSLLLSLPPGRDYRVIFLERPLAEVVASQALMIERRGTKGAPLSPKALEKALEGHLRQVRGWLSRRPDIQVLTAGYHRLLATARSESERVRDFLGREMDIEAMARQVDPSLRHHQSG